MEFQSNTHMQLEPLNYCNIELIDSHGELICLQAH